MSGEGAVPCWSADLHSHLNWKLVERRIFAVYSKAGQAVLVGRHKEDAFALILVSYDPRCCSTSGIK